jgi:hypothetical protein
LKIIFSKMKGLTNLFFHLFLCLTVQWGFFKQTGAVFPSKSLSLIINFNSWWDVRPIFSSYAGNWGSNLGIACNNTSFLFEFELGDASNFRPTVLHWGRQTAKVYMGSISLLDQSLIHMLHFESFKNNCNQL